jgi:hypothetical protein
VTFKAYHLTLWIVALAIAGYAEWLGFQSSTDVNPTLTDLIKFLPDWLIAFGIAALVLHFKVGLALVEQMVRLLSK